MIKLEGMWNTCKLCWLCTITDLLLKTVKCLNFKTPTLSPEKHWERIISSLSLFLIMSKMSSKHDLFASSERTTKTHQAVYLQLLRNGLLTHSPSSRAAGWDGQPVGDIETFSFVQIMSTKQSVAMATVVRDVVGKVTSTAVVERTERSTLWGSQSPATRILSERCSKTNKRLKLIFIYFPLFESGI